MRVPGYVVVVLTLFASENGEHPQLHCAHLDLGADSRVRVGVTR